jgi:hypothetical protein
LTIAVDPIRGPIIKLFVCVSGPRASVLQKSGIACPQPVLVDFLVDTGASSTVVDEQAIAPLGLTPTGQTQVHTPTTGAGVETRFLYDVGLAIYHADHTRIFESHPVIATDFSAQNIGGLLGRDVLASCLFHYDGTGGHFSLAF